MACCKCSRGLPSQAVAGFRAPNIARTESRNAATLFSANRNKGYGPFNLLIEKQLKDCVTLILLGDYAHSLWRKVRPAVLIQIIANQRPGVSRRTANDRAVGYCGTGEPEHCANEHQSVAHCVRCAAAAVNV
jgi:hypothetical protein